MTESDAAPTCPLCMEDLDETDRNFYPCPCGYQICIWCLEYVRTTLNGLCPACRRPYSESQYRTKSPESEPTKKNTAVSKSANKTAPNLLTKSDSGLPPSMHQLRDMRVLQRNLAYVVGLPSNLASRKDILVSLEYFGRYGKVENLVVTRVGSSDPSFTAYVTYGSVAHAIDAIADTDGAMIDGRILKSSFGTTKYCSYFLRDLACNRANCFYLHQLGDEADSFTREQMVASRAAFSERALKRAQQTLEANDEAVKTLYRWQVSHSASSPLPKFFGTPISESVLREAERAGIDISDATTSRRRSVADGSNIIPTSSPTRNLIRGGASNSNSNVVTGQAATTTSPQAGITTTSLPPTNKSNNSSVRSASLTRSTSPPEQQQQQAVVKRHEWAARLRPVDKSHVRKPSNEFPSLGASIATAQQQQKGPITGKPSTNVWKKRTDQENQKEEKKDEQQTAIDSNVPHPYHLPPAEDFFIALNPSSELDARLAQILARATRDQPMPQRTGGPFFDWILPRAFEEPRSFFGPRWPGEEKQQQIQQQSVVVPPSQQGPPPQQQQQLSAAAYEQLRQHIRNYEEQVQRQIQHRINTLRAAGDRVGAERLESERAMVIDLLVKARVSELLKQPLQQQSNAAVQLRLRQEQQQRIMMNARQQALRALLLQQAREGGGMPSEISDQVRQLLQQNVDWNRQQQQQQPITTNTAVAAQQYEDAAAQQQRQLLHQQAEQLIRRHLSAQTAPLDLLRSIAPNANLTVAPRWEESWP